MAPGGAFDWSLPCLIYNITGEPSRRATLNASATIARIQSIEGTLPLQGANNDH
jgi:hypothetical protein